MTKAEAIAMLKRIQEPEAWEPQINQAAFEALDMAIEALSQESSEDVISRQAAIDALIEWYGCEPSDIGAFEDIIEKMPSAQPEQRYTEEELRVFAHGISLSLLSKRSAQHWRYDEDTATEIKFLERLYEKVGADMRGEQDDEP